MRVRLELATPEDAADIVALAAGGDGRTEKRVLFAMRHSSVFIARHQGKAIATLTLSTKRPWAMRPATDGKYFTASRRPLYLTGMDVHPDLQGKGIGWQCLAEARRVALEWPADAIRLDAYDRTTGAGEFYRKCGYAEVGRAAYRNTPLIYFELLLG